MKINVRLSVRLKRKSQKLYLTQIVHMPDTRFPVYLLYLETNKQTIAALLEYLMLSIYVLSTKTLS